MNRRFLTLLLLVVLTGLVSALTWKVSQLTLRCEKLENQLLAVQTQIAQNGLSRPELRGRAADQLNPREGGAPPEKHRGRTDSSQMRAADFTARAVILHRDGAPALTAPQIEDLTKLLSDCEGLLHRQNRLGHEIDTRLGGLMQVLSPTQIAYLDSHRADVDAKCDEMRVQLTRGREDASVYAQSIEYLRSLKAQ